MEQATAAPLKKTPLNARHRASGAQDGAVWRLGHARRVLRHHPPSTWPSATRAGLFDVSHMGEIEIAGKDALAAVQRISCNDASRLQVGQAQYSALMTPQGTFVDDLLVYRLAAAHFLLVVNAATSRRTTRGSPSTSRRVGDAVAVDASSRYALLAVQGPRRSKCCSRSPVSTRRHEVLLVRARGSRERARDHLAHRLHRRGRLRDLRPAAVGRPRLAGDARSGHSGRASSRAASAPATRCASRPAMRLYGNDIDETTTALEADLGWIVGWKKDDFIGADVLRAQKADGVARKLVGFEMVDRGIARHGYDAYVGDEKAGVVTSGTQTPFLKKAIGMAYRAGRRTPRRHRVRRRHPRPPHPRARRADAVLQATEVGRVLRPGMERR